MVSVLGNGAIVHNEKTREKTRAAQQIVALLLEFSIVLCEYVCVLIKQTKVFT